MFREFPDATVYQLLCAILVILLIMETFISAGQIRETEQATQMYLLLRVLTGEIPGVHL